MIYLHPLMTLHWMRLDMQENLKIKKLNMEVGFIQLKNVGHIRF